MVAPSEDGDGVRYFGDFMQLMRDEDRSDTGLFNSNNKFNRLLSRLH